MPSMDEYRVRARGRLAYYNAMVSGYLHTAEQAPHWLPGLSLQSECRSALELIDGMEERLERKLLVTLIGPTGAGKSTLLNALAGGRPLSPTGIDRPTTRSLVAYCRSTADLQTLDSRIDPGALAVHSDAAAPHLENVILLDTPDMDSTESAAFRPLLEQIIGLSDVLVCVFNAENPKRKDTIDFLHGFVNRFPGSGLFVVLNRCDRIRPGTNAPRRYSAPVPAVTCAIRTGLRASAPCTTSTNSSACRRRFSVNSTRRSASWTPAWSAPATWRQRSASRPASAWPASAVAWPRCASKSCSWEVLRGGIVEAATGLQALFYQKLAGRWWGPLGWLLALWARLLMTGAGLVAAMRPGRPAMQLWGAVSAVTRYRKTRGEVEQTLQGGDLEPVMLRYRLILQQSWPDLAQKLVAVGFSRCATPPR